MVNPFQYEKIPVIVEAFQFDPLTFFPDPQRDRDPPPMGDGLPEHWPEWIREAWAMRKEEKGALWDLGGGELGITTLETPMESFHMVFSGDWIIRGVVGEIYPCKDEVFQKTYKRPE